MAQHVFISHSSQDDPIVGSLETALNRQKILAWVDTAKLRVGDELDPSIVTAIRESIAFVVVLSEAALKSNRVRKEVEYARLVQNTNPAFRIVPVVLDEIPSSILNAWFSEDVVSARLTRRTPDEVARAVSTILAASGLIEDSGDDENIDFDQRPLTDLILELTQPKMQTDGQILRATATARLIHQAHDGAELVGESFLFTAPLGPIEVDDLKWYLESFYRWTSDVMRDRAKRIEDQFPEWGKLLFDAALSDPNAQRILNPWRNPRSADARKALRRFTVFVNPAANADADEERRSLALEAATKLLALPWELLHDAQSYLFHGARGVRVRRRLPDADVIEPKPTKPPIRVLLVSPRPDDDQARYIDHRVSARPVVDALALLGDVAQLTLLDPPTFSSLDAEMRRADEAGTPYHVVHFDGHGVYDKKHGWGALCFEHPDDIGKPEERRSEIVSADKLAACLRDYRIPLFVLEACESAQTQDNPTASVAGQLLACGVASVVAMSHTVLVETARRFVTVFYRELVRGRRIGQAMLEGQRALYGDTFRAQTFNGPLHMQDWFVPVLFQERPDPRLIEHVPNSLISAANQRARKLAFGQLPPAPAHSFVGRSQELLSAERQLCGTRLLPNLGQRERPHDARYVVLVGEGGEGKTTLAAELARWLIETQRFEKGAFVSVEHEASVHSVLSLLGDQLAINYVGETQNNDEAGLKLLKKTLKDHASVIVIDNLESILGFTLAATSTRSTYISLFSSASASNDVRSFTVIPSTTSEGDAQECEIEEAEAENSKRMQVLISNEAKDVLTPLLEMLAELNEVGRTRLIFTSQSPLPEPFAGHCIHVDRLSRAEAVELVGQVLKQEGRNLRAADADQNEDPIDKLVDAVNCHARSLVLLARELSETGAEATTDNLVALMHRLHKRYPNDRERSLFASLELSLRRLPAEIRRRISKLAVFHGGAHAWSIAQVLGLDYSKDEEQPIIAALIQVGLAQPMGYGYIRLEPALAPYLRVELNDAERQAAEAAWIGAMTQLTAFLYEQQFKEPRQAAALALLELPNLLAALSARHAAADGSLCNTATNPTALSTYESLIEMATSVEHLLQNLGRPRALAQAAAIRTQAAAKLAQLNKGWSRAQFHAMCSAIDRLLDAGRSTEAVVAAQRLLSRFHPLAENAYPNADYDFAQAYVYLGRALRISGNAAAALDPLTEARRRFELIGQSGNTSATRMTSVCLTDYADCLVQLGRLDEAAKAYGETIQAAQDVNDQRMVATNKGQLGTVRLMQRCYADALTAWCEALKTFEQLGEPGSVATAWHMMGLIHQEAGHYDHAEHAYQQSLLIKIQRGDRRGEASTLNQLGRLASLRGRAEEAVRFYKQAAGIYASSDTQDLVMEGLTRNNVADVLVYLGRHEDARREIMRTLECKAPFGHAAQPWKSYEILSNIERIEGNHAAAAVARAQAIDRYLAFRRDGGENLNTGGRLAEAVADALGSDDTGRARQQLAEIACHPDLPDDSSLHALISALTKILNGSRDPVLAEDGELKYDDAAEIRLLLERLS